MKPALTIAICQLQADPGNLFGNLAQIATYLDLKADLIVFPAFCLTGANLKNLVLRKDFQAKVELSLEQLRYKISSPVLLGGIFADGLGIKYLTATQQVNLPPMTTLELKGYHLGVGVDRFVNGDLSIKMAAVPFTKNKLEEIKPNFPAVEVNLVGGVDESVFYGGSKIWDQKGIWQQLEYFLPQHRVVTWKNEGWEGNRSYLQYSPIALLYGAMVKGLQDYVRQNNFAGVILGVSGGIDSALSLTIAVDALGSQKVKAFYLPSRYSSILSKKLAELLCQRLKVDFNLWSIEDLHKMYEFKLSSWTKIKPVVNENLQARIRANLLMAVANQNNFLLLSTGNKSELAIGYTTLYGDMAGGFNLLNDIFKTEVYHLAKFRNSLKAVIPTEILTRFPTAELALNQKDQDVLPDYNILDAILIALEEGEDELTLKKRFGAISNWVYGRWLKSEFKRRQSCLGLRFSKTYSLPVTKCF